MYDKKEEFVKGLKARGITPGVEEINFISEAYTAWGEHWGVDYPAWFAENLSVFGTEQDVRNQLEDYISEREDVRTILNVNTDADAVDALMDSDGEPFYLVSEKNGKWFLFDAPF